MEEERPLGLIEEQDEPSPDHVWVKRAAKLEDYLGEEVVDKAGKLIGILECYWEGEDGLLVLCGIQMNQAVRVAPARRAQISERHSWVRLGFPADEIAAAPIYDCDEELNEEFERNVYHHYGMTEAQPHSRLKYFAGKH